MENVIKINNEIADLIIKLCFSINDLKKSCQSNDKGGLHFFSTYNDIKTRMDNLLQVSSSKAMSAKITETKAFAKNSLKIYKIFPTEINGRDKTIQTLNRIVNQLTDLEKLISNPL
ncbi:hypothetical protein [Aestuariibaculum sediminum]|uniref:Uncharacterized protein n=1 Tax=Aestuariibaculum sediminum TaxID=2770637 RepID=A0A8J6QAM3_9FLAO|nr:hypothetical protein [Aestuariibaculum sediminum]MBD0833652.1 hypothetical protein [Aestuariibaculum sediminum]